MSRDLKRYKLKLPIKILPGYPEYQIFFTNYAKVQLTIFDFSDKTTRKQGFIFPKDVIEYIDLLLKAESF